jgi:hypothetical protein
MSIIHREPQYTICRRHTEKIIPQSSHPQHGICGRTHLAISHRIRIFINIISNYSAHLFLLLMNRILYFGFRCLFVICSLSPLFPDVVVSQTLTAQARMNTTFLDSLLRTQHSNFDSILANVEQYRVQILYTQINRDARNRPVFKHFSYRLDPNAYFYPASTVKLPVALAALEKMNRIGIRDKFSPVRTDSTRADQSPAIRDVSAPDSMPSVGHYVKKIFHTSDNDANNRLLEFVTPDELNDSLRAKGYTNVKITRRLGIGSSPAQDSLMNPVRFTNRSGSILYAQPGSVPRNTYNFPALRDVKQGKGVMQGDSLLNRPIDFTASNYISLETLQRILRAAIFPEAVPQRERFALTPDDYELVYTAMATFPRESISPKYDTTEYPDSYVKFTMFGNTKQPIPKHIRIFNKVGDAYGYLLDNAYVVDFKKNIEFFVSAVIYVNADGIFNDDKYEYDSVGFPFFANLGTCLYEYETMRKRAHKPNLAKFTKYQTPAQSSPRR